MTLTPPPVPALSEGDAARELLRAIEAQGHTALIVGGAVRDHVLGLPMHDIDIATDMPMEAVGEVFRAYDVGRSKAFGVFVVLHRGWSFEVAGFRRETRFDEQGRPVGMGSSATFAEDARHRDLTVNALGMDLRGAIHDPWGGLEDLRRGVIRGVDNPGDRFDEDPVRCLRAVRLTARLGFVLDPDTEAALRSRAGKIAAAAPERLADELVKMASATGERFAEALLLLDRVGLLEHLLPEVCALKGLPQDARWHPEGDVFQHTLAACRASRVQDPLVHLAVLLHDVGKAATHEEHGGSHTYLGHEDRSADQAEAVADRFRFSTKWRGALSRAARCHMLVPRLAEMRPSKVFRLVEGESWEVVKETAFCDLKARGEAFREGDFLAMIARAEEAARDWRSRRNRSETQKTIVSGHRLMALTGLAPGPAVGRLLRAVTDWAMDHGVSDPGEVEAYLLSAFRAKRDGSEGGRAPAEVDTRRVRDESSALRSAGTADSAREAGDTREEGGDHEEE